MDLEFQQEVWGEGKAVAGSCDPGQISFGNSMQISIALLMVPCYCVQLAVLFPQL